MVTFTVIAVLVTPPDEGVIVRVDDFDPPPPFPLQPATSTNTIMAPNIPKRMRNRRASGSMKSRPIASMMKSTCRSNADGGTFMDCGGTMRDAATMEPLAVAPGDGAALVVGTEQEVISIPGVQVKATAPVKPPSPVTTTGNEPVAPLATLTAAAETEKSHAIPVSETACGLPLALSVIVSDPVTGPGAVPAAGANVTVTVQLAPTAKVAPHVVVLPKLVEMLGGLVKFNTALPLLVSVTGSCGALVVVNNWPAKARLETEIPRTGPLLVPAPVKATWIRLADVSAPSNTLNVADSLPGIDGVKISPYVHVAGEAARDAPQVVVSGSTAKSPGFAPVKLTGGGVSVIGDEVLFVSVTICAGEVGVPTSCVPKLMLVGDTEIVGVKGRSATNAFVAVLFNFDWITPGVTGKSEEEVWPVM